MREPEFSIIVSKHANGSDIRGFGSGNAGITNYIRSFGTKSALGVLIGDVLKCVVPVLLAGWMVGFMGKLVAGIAVILGHMFPVFFRFRGGKGVLTTAALILVIDWRIFLICISLFAVIVQFTRYVSLGQVCGSCFAFLHMALLRRQSAFYCCYSANSSTRNIYAQVEYKAPDQGTESSSR